MARNTGLKSVLKLILCHHSEEQRDRCIAVPFFSRKILLCSRCLGLYPAALLWLFLSVRFRIILAPGREERLILLFVLPALAEWSLSGLGLFRSNNLFRFFSGLAASFALARYWFLWGDPLKNSGVILSVTLTCLAFILPVLFLMIRHDRFGREKEAVK